MRKDKVRRNIEGVEGGGEGKEGRRNDGGKWRQEEMNVKSGKRQEVGKREIEQERSSFACAFSI